MPTELEVIEARALKLTAEERARLADRLIASLFEDKDIERGRSRSSGASRRSRAAAPSSFPRLTPSPARAPRSNDPIG